MAKYLIYADESQYCGLHGIYDWDVVECDTKEEAQEIGVQMSYEVINSYSDLVGAYEEEAEQVLRDNGLTPEDPEWDDAFSNYVDDCISENTQYRIFELNPNFDYSTINTQYEDWEEICNIYAVKEI